MALSSDLWRRVKSELHEVRGAEHAGPSPVGANMIAYPGSPKGEAMRIGIIGAGAIGCVVGGLLTRRRSRRDAGGPVAGARGDHASAAGCGSRAPAATTGSRCRRSTSTSCSGSATPFDAVFVAGEVLRHRVGAPQLGAGLSHSPTAWWWTSRTGSTTSRVAAVAGTERTLGCVILIGAGMYEPGHALRTDAGNVGLQDRRARRPGHAAGAAPGRGPDRRWRPRRSPPTSGASAGPSSPSTAWRIRWPGSRGLGTAEVRMRSRRRRLASRSTSAPR